MSERERKNPAKTEIINEGTKTRTVGSNTTFHRRTNETTVEDEQSTVRPHHFGTKDEDRLEPRTLFVEDLNGTFDLSTNNSIYLHNNTKVEYFEIPSISETTTRIPFPSTTKLFVFNNNTKDQYHNRKINFVFRFNRKFDIFNS